ncbi:restriction endonuclease subunit S [Ruegeria arenilitoris]|uniref:restriction endonuclease subunit S n=1 Tax=Ruegeria arenilitoris TaxID=1173585 RepID=UPI00147DBECE|nr:restriction endonuclease subunit S [Ruegeria arenilitoris]
MVPEGWCEVRVRDLKGANGRPVTKLGPFGSALKKSDYTEAGYKVYGQQQVLAGDQNFGDYWIGQNKFDQLKACSVQEGDILLSTMGSFGSVLRLSEGCAKGIINPRLLRLSVDPMIAAPEFLEVYLKSTLAERQFFGFAQGGTMPAINGASIGGLKLTLPPVAEQRKIADILSTWDRAIEVAEAQLGAARTSKRALMQQLLAGKRRFPEFEGEEWKEVRLGDLGSFKKGKGLPKTEVGPMGQFPCILYGELYTTYGEVIEATVSHTDLDDGVISEAGDVLIPASTTTTGIDLAIASCVVKSGIRLGGDINIFRRAGNSINGAFLAYYLTHIRRHDMARFAQGITIVHLKGSDLLNIKIDIPPMEEQEKIVAVLLETEGQIIGLQSQITKLRTEKKALMQQLLTGKRRVMV